MRRWIALLLFLPLSALAAEKPTILFVGSSSVEYWQPRIAQDFPQYQTVDMGVGATMYPYISSHIADFTQRASNAEKVVIYSGDNDLMIYGPQSVAANFVEAAQALHSAFPKAQLYVISIKPCPSWARASAASVKATNDLLKADSAQLNQASVANHESPYITYVDIFPQMLGADGNPNSTLFRWDGIHMNDSGYNIWVAALHKVL